MKKVALFEIFLLVTMSFAFSYFIHESAEISPQGNTDERGISWLREKILDYLSNGLVSAQEGLWTCLENVNGSLCQEYPAEICDENCLDSCIPARRSETAECRLGTCVDSNEGLCTGNVPKLACEGSGGTWTEEEPALCTPGCCLLGGNANYITEQACSILGDRLGQNSEWQPVNDELECLLLASEQEEGACVSDGCSFGTRAECLSVGGEFYLNSLCTNPDLNTECQITEETTCVDGRDGVYFLDSCGNTANIYDYDKRNDEDYWSRVYSRDDSCSLNGNEDECGNCDYLLGSTCGEPGERDSDPKLGDFVCKDLSCVDEWGDDRKNGESWCAFDSKIGVDGEKNKGRSVDVPGSRHYRRICLDGEVRTDACQDFRGEVCQESRDEEIGFSSAACRVNGWQECISANQDQEDLNRCEENSNCFLKKVRIDDFKFDVCAPKHPPGFNLNQEYGGETAETICSAGSQVCRQVWVKKFSGWDCETNCDCDNPEFTETMNNLCISLGDCGGHVNLEGEFTDSGYSVKRAPKLKSSYIDDLRDYTNPDKGQKVDAIPLEEIAALYGLDVNDPDFDESFANVLGGLGAGATGAILAYAAIKLGGIGALITAIKGIGLYGIVNVPTIGVLSSVPVVVPALSGFLASAGALAAGGAIGLLIGNLFGLQGDALTALTVLGIFSGIAVHTGLFGLFEGIPFLQFGSWFLWTAIVIVIIAIILKFMGIGDTKIKKITFSCLPWQPPLGGRDCSSCGDYLECSEYKCQSLGQTCELINEGTSDAACVDVAPDDSSPPKISPNYDFIGEDYSYEDVSERGFKVVHNQQECIPAYAQVDFGISLDEHGQCKYDVERTQDYNEMEFFFGESSLFKENHGMSIIMPSLEDLGEFGIDPDRRADFNMYLRCQDRSGNKNIEEYNIRFCVSPEDDITPPILQRFQPESPGYTALDQESFNLTFFTNEPAECKWSDQDADYDLMINEISCENDIGDLTLFGFECNTELPVTEDENDYYLRCKDNPLGEEGERNANRESTEYKVIKTQEALMIDSINLSPRPVDDVILEGSEPVSVDLEVRTSGGAPLNRYCTYGFNGENDLALFFETGTDTHKQTFSSLFSGSYDIGIRCEDDAGNFASDSVQFEIDVDDIGPRITRVYNKDGLIYVVTDENAECRYEHNSCGFSFEEGFEMNGRELVHTDSFDESLNYYIKCQDDWGNSGQCITVRAGY